MNFEVDRYSSAWAHIALCADLTWATEPPDDFIIANQRLWTQHCRVTQALQDALETQNLQINNQCEPSENCRNSNQTQENGSCSGRSVKDVIPESRLAQFYGNFYYDEVRESSYTNANEKSHPRSYNGQGCENSDLTECWMLPEVEFWYRKLVDENPDRSAAMPRRRRHYRMLADDDLILRGKVNEVILFVPDNHIPRISLVETQPNGHRSAVSERWGPVARSEGEEAALAARVRGVRGLWGARSPRAPSPPPPPRKIRARRRQPRRLAALAPPPPAYCLDVPAQLLCDPSCKFETPRPPQLTECQRAMGRLSASVQALMRASAARCPPYRGTNVSRYAPTSQRPVRCPDRRYGVWWPRDHPSPRLDHKFHLRHNATLTPQTTVKKEPEEVKNEESATNKETETTEQEATPDDVPETTQQPEEEHESPKQTEKEIVDDQIPSTSAAAADQGSRQKRLYSTVLSMSAPAPINLTAAGCVRLSQKLAPGLLKLNPKIVLPAARIRPQNSDNKFEELEKEALEQYKASDESIDTKFRELEKQAVEQYSTSNSNTSCSSGNSSEKKNSSSSSIPEDSPKETPKQPTKFHKEKTVDSVVIYSQNFPDLNAKGQTKNSSLKNFHTPQRGEKKEQSHRSSKSLRNCKNDSQRAASDTDYESRDVRESTKGSHKGSARWTLHVMPPKKRHLTLCVSDFSSDEDREDAAASFIDAGPCIKNRGSGKMKMSAHGGGDLIMRKT